MIRDIHPLVAEVLEKGYVEHEGQQFELHSNIPVEECRLLYRAVEAAEASTALEVGMAYGISTVILADALNRSTETPTLISIDPYQHEIFHGTALGQLSRAGFAHFCELLEAPAHSALPRLVERGFHADLALIDGWHTFDHTLVDFFYIDLLLRRGGIVVLDDTWMPGVRAVAEFVLRNRAYSVIDSVSMQANRRAKLKRTIRHRHRLAPETAAVALRKDKEEDDRPWHHFVSFPT